MDLIAQLARELNLKAANIEAAVKLIDEGNTIPFISRYRKEATGGMDDVACAPSTSACHTCAILSSAKRTLSCSSTPRVSSRPSSSSRSARPRSSSVSRTSTSPTAKSA